MAALVGLFAIPLWGIFWPEENPEGLWYFWLLYLLMQLRARIESARMIARGEYVHTHYNGWPRVARFFPKMNELKIKGSMEPVITIVIGAALLSVSVPLGSYLIFAGLSLGVTHGVIQSVDRARALDMNDAFIEQQQSAERFRAMQRDHRDT